MLQSFETARKDIRMEEPLRILTRFAFDFVRNIFKTSLSENKTNSPSSYDPLSISR